MAFSNPVISPVGVLTIIFLSSGNSSTSFPFSIPVVSPAEASTSILLLSGSSSTSLPLSIPLVSPALIFTLVFFSSGNSSKLFFTSAISSLPSAINFNFSSFSSGVSWFHSSTDILNSPSPSDVIVKTSSFSSLVNSSQPSILLAKSSIPVTSASIFNIALTSVSVISNSSAICLIVSSEISPVLRISAWAVNNKSISCSVTLLSDTISSIKLAIGLGWLTLALTKYSTSISFPLAKSDVICVYEFCKVSNWLVNLSAIPPLPIFWTPVPYEFRNFCNALFEASIGAGSNDKAVFQVSVFIPVILFKEVAISFIALLAPCKSPVVST